MQLTGKEAVELFSGDIGVNMSSNKQSSDIFGLSGIIRFRNV